MLITCNNNYLVILSSLMVYISFDLIIMIQNFSQTLFELNDDLQFLPINRVKNIFFRSNAVANEMISISRFEFMK